MKLMLAYFCAFMTPVAIGMIACIIMDKIEKRKNNKEKTLEGKKEEK